MPNTLTEPITRAPSPLVEIVISPRPAIPMGTVRAPSPATSRSPETSTTEAASIISPIWL